MNLQPRMPPQWRSRYNIIVHAKLPANVYVGHTGSHAGLEGMLLVHHDV